MNAERQALIEQVAEAIHGAGGWRERTWAEATGHVRRCRLRQAEAAVTLAGRAIIADLEDIAAHALEDAEDAAVDGLVAAMEAVHRFTLGAGP